MPLLGSLTQGDRVLSVCGEKTDHTDHAEVWNKVWKLTEQKIREDFILVQRIFVSDRERTSEEEYSRSILYILAQHLDIWKRLRADCLNWRLKLRILSSELRRTFGGVTGTLLESNIGFSLISHGSQKFVAFHRIGKSGDMKGWILSDLLIYTVLEQHFWLVWSVSRNLRPRSKSMARSQ